MKFKDLLACMQKFVESDDKIKVMLNVGDVVCLECGCWGCEISLIVGC